MAPTSQAPPRSADAGVIKCLTTPPTQPSLPGPQRWCVSPPFHCQRAQPGRNSRNGTLIEAPWGPRQRLFLVFRRARRVPHHLLCQPARRTERGGENACGQPKLIHSHPHFPRSKNPQCEANNTEWAGSYPQASRLRVPRTPPKARKSSRTIQASFGVQRLRRNLSSMREQRE